MSVQCFAVNVKFALVVSGLLRQQSSVTHVSITAFIVLRSSAGKTHNTMFWMLSDRLQCEDYYFTIYPLIFPTNKSHVWRTWRLQWPAFYFVTRNWS